MVLKWWQSEHYWLSCGFFGFLLQKKKKKKVYQFVCIGDSVRVRAAVTGWQ
jgi:hypothetical protein